MGFSKTLLPALLPFRSTYWYMSPVQVDGGTTAAITQDRLYALPIFLPGPTSIAKIGVYVTTGSATNLRFGLYADNAGVPGALIAESGNVSANVTNAEVAWTVGVIYPAGWYWLAMVGSGTPTMQYISAGENTTIMGMTTVDLTTRITHLFKAHTFGALPNPFGTPTDSPNNAPGIRFNVT